MKRSGRIKRKHPLKRFNPERRDALRDRQFGGTYADLIRSLPCSVGSDECAGRMEAAHAKSRGAGGTWRDLLPLCTRHHRIQHEVGIRTFEARYAVSLSAVAAKLAERFLELAPDADPGRIGEVVPDTAPEF